MQDHFFTSPRFDCISLITFPVVYAFNARVYHAIFRSRYRFILRLQRFVLLENFLYILTLKILFLRRKLCPPHILPFLIKDFVFRSVNSGCHLTRIQRNKIVVYFAFRGKLLIQRFINYL